ncbi:hypothetical protein BKA93DRAFT_883386 [Sparassis latifolia]
MAAPQTMNTLNISGKYVMNKTLSDDSDDILRLQGVGWLIRKTIRITTLHLYCKHYVSETVEHIDVDQTLNGIKGTAENRTFDWTERLDYDYVFGATVCKSKRIRIDELENEFLKTGWLEDTKEHGGLFTVEYSDTEKSGKTWIAEQVWGFEEVNGERRHTRRIAFSGPKEEKLHTRLVYDYRE